MTQLTFGDLETARSRIKSRLELEFEEFDRKNPHVYRMFEEFTFKAIRRGHKRIGAKFVVEWLRFETEFETGDRHFKIPNVHTRYLAKKFARLHPKSASIFAIRGANSESEGETNE